MKLGKRKFTGIIAISLAAVALTSVGFAAWTINASDVKDEDNEVSVTTGSILADNRFTFTAAIDTDDDSVAFDSTVGNGIITGTGGEDLTFKVKANIKGPNLTTSVEGIYINFIDTENKYSKMISDGLIQSPIAFGLDSNPGVKVIDGTKLEAGDLVDGGKYTDPSSVSKYTYQITSGADTSLDIAFTFNFAWGSTFGFKNPTEAINNAGDGANAMIEKLKTLTSNYANPKLEVVVTAKAKTASA